MFLDEIAALLVANNVGILGTSIFIGSNAPIPAGAGPYLSILETGGSGPSRIQNSKSPATQRPTAQVLARGLSYVTTRALSKAAYDVLDGVYGETLSNIAYLKITSRQEPTDMGLDGAGRVLIVFNIDAEKQPS